MTLHPEILTTTLFGAILILIDSTSCSGVAETPRILGGTPAKPGEFPWVISLQKKIDATNLWHKCGGAIITENLVITAAHCTQNRTLSDLLVVAGAHDVKRKEDSQQRRDLLEIFTHPDYVPSMKPGPHDISVIRVDPPFTLNSRVDTMTLASREEQASGECTYAGWGNTFPITLLHSQPPEHMIKGKATIVNKDSCKSAYSLHGNQVTTAICAQAGILHGTCQGDSGGPLTCPRKDNSRYLAGVVSFGFTVCNSGIYPDVYTDLGYPSIFDFIKDTVKQHGSPSHTSKSKHDKKSDTDKISDTVTSKVQSDTVTNQVQGDSVTGPVQSDAVTDQVPNGGTSISQRDPDEEVFLGTVLANS